MGQQVQIVPGTVPKTQSVEAFAQEFRQALADLRRIARILKSLGKALQEAELVVSLTEKERAAVGRRAFVSSLDLHGAMECGLEEEWREIQATKRFFFKRFPVHW